MKLLIDKNGNAGFDEWFWASDATKIVEALTAVRTDIEIEKVDWEFKDIPILAKKLRYEPIPLTPRNIVIILGNVDKDNDVILKLLGIKRDSDFVITTIIRRLEQEYQCWEKIDLTKQWKDRQESIKAFAEYYSKTLEA